MARLRLCALMAAFAAAVALPSTAAADREDVRLGVGLANPTSMALAPDGRIFVNEQAGKVRVIKNGALLADPFVQLSVTSNNERGLLGITFDPNFATNRYLYLYYTRASSTVVNRLSRFRASAVNPDVVEPGSETPVLDDIPSQTGWHNGGAIHFGGDGRLYVAVGEGHASDNAQRMDHLGGKLLRIDADGSIPTDNPFYDTATGVFRSIWALGLRNPFTFDVQPGTGRIFINDVGENAFEEINEAWSGPNTGSNAGFNFGWPATEGPTTDPDYHTPFYAYPQTSANGNCALTGGSFYNPTTVNFPAQYVGDYFFTDFCNGWVDSIDLTTKEVTRFLDIDRTRDPVDIKVGPDGSLYYLSRENGNPGSVHRVRYTGTNDPPAVVTHPQDASTTVGGSATFSVSASGTAPLSYQWQRNGTNISGATGSSYTFSNAQLANDGDQFRVVVTNTAGSATSNAATLTVTADQPPTATITAPAAGSLYSGGQTINYSGTGTDPEDGALGSSRFTWRVDFHHEDHLHPFMPDDSGGKIGSFVASATGETSADVWYRIHLTVRDSAGQTSTAYRDVLPRKVNITLATNIAGLELNLDGQPVDPPHTVTGVVGVERTLGAPSPQTIDSVRYELVAWSDGGAQSHTITTPANDSAYVATFRPVAGVPPATNPLSPATNPLAPATNPLAPALGPPLPAVSARAAMAMRAPKRISWARARRHGIPVRVRGTAGAPARVVVWAAGWRSLGSRRVRLGATGDRLVRVRVRGRAPARTLRARIEVSAAGEVAVRRIVLRTRR